MSFWYSALPAAGVAGVRGVASRWLLAGVLGALAEKPRAGLAASSRTGCFVSYGFFWLIGGVSKGLYCTSTVLMTVAL